MHFDSVEVDFLSTPAQRELNLILNKLKAADRTRALELIDQLTDEYISHRLDNRRKNRQEDDRQDADPPAFGRRRHNGGPTDC